MYASRPMLANGQVKSRLLGEDLGIKHRPLSSNEAVVGEVCREDPIEQHVGREALFLNRGPPSAEVMMEERSHVTCIRVANDSERTRTFRGPIFPVSFVWETQNSEDKSAFQPILVNRTPLGEEVCDPVP